MSEPVVSKSEHKPFRPDVQLFGASSRCIPPGNKPFPNRPVKSAHINDRRKKYLSLEELRQSRKTLRTYIRTPDGTLVDAKIDLSSGEVTPHDYKAISAPLKVRRSVIVVPCENPPWVRIPAATRGIPAREQDRSYKRIFNGLKMYLGGYLTLREAVADLPLLENLIVGALQLDLGGNSRPLNPNLIFAILQQLDWISSETIETFVGCTTRHAQRIAMVLRIILRGFVAESERNESVIDHVH
jgi:hypothetical protein